MTFAQQNPQDTALSGTSVFQDSAPVRAPQHLSVWNWNTGQPSIFGGLQKDASISKRAAETQGTRFRQDPVRIIKKPNRNGSGRTIPLGKRIDLDAVYEYRMSGKTWAECAKQFNCSSKHIHEKMTDRFPELRKVYFGGKERPGNRPKDIDMVAVIRDILGGMSIRQAAPRYGISHVSLGRKLKQTTNGAYAAEVARNRALDMNAAKKAEAQDRRNKCQFTEQGAADRKKVANKLSTGSKAAANSLLSCESTGS